MINQIIATVLSIPLGIIDGYYLAKIIPEEHKVIKKYFKPAFTIATIILFTTITLTIIKQTTLIANSVSLLLLSIIMGIKIQMKSQKNNEQKK